MFYKNSNVVERTIGHTYLLVNITDNYVNDTCSLYEINEIGHFIWNNIDKAGNSHLMAKLLQSALIDEIDPEELREDIASYLKELEKQHFLVGGKEE